MMSLGQVSLQHVSPSLQQQEVVLHDDDDGFSLAYVARMLQRQAAEPRQQQAAKLDSQGQQAAEAEAALPWELQDDQKAAAGLNQKQQLAHHFLQLADHFQQTAAAEHYQ
jgi:hypothetical protein